MVQNLGSNLNLAEPDCGPVQGSGLGENRTNGPVLGSESTLFGEPVLNGSEPEPDRSKHPSATTKFPLR